MHSQNCRRNNEAVGVTNKVEETNNDLKKCQWLKPMLLIINEENGLNFKGIRKWQVWGKK